MFMLAAMNVHPVDEGGWGGVWAASVRTRANVQPHTHIRTHSNTTPPPRKHARTHATQIVCARSGPIQGSGPSARYEHGFTAIGGTLYLFGGFTVQGALSPAHPARTPATHNFSLEI